MIIDAARLGDGTHLNADVLVIGAGPAGIVLSRTLDRAGISVLLVESGGVRKRRDLQRLNEGAVDGDYPNPRFVRRRQFGGTANRWNIELGGQRAARYASLDALDFERRPDVAFSGWPFGLDHLEPYYERAYAECGVNAAADRPDEGVAAPLPLDPTEVRTDAFRLGARGAFLEAHREFAPAVNCQVVLNTTVLTLITEAGSTSVRGASAVTRRGHNIQLGGRVVVLAAGGLENPRLLLLSSTTHRAGLGNAHDLVGRTLMEHPQSHGALFTPANAQILRHLPHYDFGVKGAAIQGRLVLDEVARERHRLLGFSAMLFPRSPTHLSAPYATYTRLADRVASRVSPVTGVRDVRDLIAAAPSLSRHAFRRLTGESAKPDQDHGGWSDSRRGAARYRVAEVISLLEQSPNPQNRVTLGDGRDPLGQRLLNVSWRFSPEDSEALERSRAFLQRAFATAGVGRLEFPDRDWDVASSHHPMGTTRMHDDPHRGVVDRNARVHGVENLYVAGSSVFPTSGHVPPTLTITAMTLRLADHLIARLRPVATPVRETTPARENRADAWNDRDAPSADTEPSVSVVIPTKNRLSRLEAIVPALLADPATTELIVVSDGSTDGTSAWLAELAATDPRVRPIILTDSAGALGARRRGYLSATKDLVLLLDDDVQCDDRVVSRHAARHAAAERPSVVVGYMPTEVPPSPAGSFSTVLYAREYENNCRTWTTDPASVLTSFWGGNASFPREALCAFAPPHDAPSDMYHEDRVLGIELHLAGLAGVFDPSIAAVHLHTRNLDQSIAQWRRQGRDAVFLHDRYHDVIGPLNLASLTTANLPRPLVRLVEATDRVVAYRIARRGLRAVLLAAGRLGPFAIEIRTGQLLRRIELRHSILATIDAAPS